MLFEYRVLSLTELFAPPSVWQLPATRARQYAVALQDALNRMAAEGWRLVESHKEPWSGASYFIFQRERGQEQEQVSAIRAARLGATL
jgi:hypothetical protein